MKVDKNKISMWTFTLVLFVCCSDEALDLLDKLLRFDPEQRWSIEEALKHSFLQQYRVPDKPRVCRPFCFGFEVGYDLGGCAKADIYILVLPL